MPVPVHVPINNTNKLSNHEKYLDEELGKIKDTSKNVRHWTRQSHLTQFIYYKILCDGIIATASVRVLDLKEKQFCFGLKDITIKVTGFVIGTDHIFC